MITASLVKELREKTGAGMLDCKKALTECNGDIDSSIDWLREKGIAKAAKKADRIAAEGLCEAVFHENKAYIYELNSETDFVAKNEKFLNLIAKIGEICIKNDCQNITELLAASLEGTTCQDLIVSATATIGEKISLRRLQVLTKNDDEVFGLYKHNGGKIVVVSVIKGNDELVAKDICMHVAMYNPRFLDDTQVDEELIEHERSICIQEIKNDPSSAKKPEMVINKMIEGKLKKFKQEICLVFQPFVKETSISVQQYLTNKGSAAVNFIRFEVGEGMQKRCDDFAAEVAAQTAAALK